MEDSSTASPGTTSTEHKSKELQALQRLATTTLMRASNEGLQHRIAGNDVHRPQVKGATGPTALSNNDIDVAFIWGI